MKKNMYTKFVPAVLILCAGCSGESNIDLARMQSELGAAASISGDVEVQGETVVLTGDAADSLCQKMDRAGGFEPTSQNGLDYLYGESIACVTNQTASLCHIYAPADSISTQDGYDVTFRGTVGSSAASEVYDLLVRLDEAVSASDGYVLSERFECVRSGANGICGIRNIVAQAIPTTGNTDTPPATSGSGIEFVTQATIMAHVNYLASDALAGRDEGTPGGIQARQYIIETLEACGVEPQNGGSFEQSISTGAGANILGVVRGTGSSGRAVMASAHYDHLGQQGGQVFNGAMDNAAAVGALLQMACGFASEPAEKNIIVAFWDAEEPPTFLTEQMGSIYFVNNPTFNLSTLDASIVLDLVGGGVWNGYEEHVAFGSEYSPEVRAAVDAARTASELKPFVAGLHLFEETPQGFLPLSDYAAFRQAGVPVVFLTDGQNKQYHTPDDTADRLNAPKLEKEAEFLYLMMAELGNASSQTSFNANGTDYYSDAVAMNALLSDAIVDMQAAAGLSSFSQSAIESDAAKVSQVLSWLDAGNQARTSDVQTLRTAMQRIQCLAGSSIPEFFCTLL